MTQLITERVLFVLPHDRELQIAAISILQDYVNTFDDRSKASDVTGGKASYDLEYNVAVDDMTVWDAFKFAGLVLTRHPRDFPVDTATMVVDFADEKLLLWCGHGKHAVQACGVMCGSIASSLPLIRRVRPKIRDYAWARLESEFAYPVGMWPTTRLINVDMLSTLKDEELTGVIGFASWQTYLAASMGLPTVEILPEGRDLNWLSKYPNSGYRVVDGPASAHLEQIASAVRSVERAMEAFVTSRTVTKMNTVSTEEIERGL